MTDETPPRLDYARPDPVRRMRWWVAAFAAHCLASWLTAIGSVVWVSRAAGDNLLDDARFILGIACAPAIVPFFLFSIVYAAVARGILTPLGIVCTVTYALILIVTFLFLRRRRGTR